MLPRLSSIVLPFLFLSSVLGLDEGSCSKDGEKEDCGAKKENKFKYNTIDTKSTFFIVQPHNHNHNFRKTVLVTGGSGFVAHHVIETILDNTDWDVVSLDRSEDTFTFYYTFLSLIKY